MEKIKVVIVEDEFVIAEDIRTQLEQSQYSVTAVFDKAEVALGYIRKEPIDLLLVHIQLAGAMDGIDLVCSAIPQGRIPFIFITANSDVATYERARQTHPHAFLVKPFSNANLLASVDLALFNFSEGKSPQSIERVADNGISAEAEFFMNHSLFVRNHGKFRKILCADILFIEAAGSYVHVQTRTERFTLSQNLSHFQKRTPLPNLMRIHRSYMVNMNHVDSFEESFVYVKDHKLPLSDNFKSQFMSKIRLL